MGGKELHVLYAERKDMWTILAESILQMIKDQKVAVNATK